MKYIVFFSIKDSHINEIKDIYDNKEDINIMLNNELNIYLEENDYIEEYEEYEIPKLQEFKYTAFADTKRNMIKRYDSEIYFIYKFQEHKYNLKDYDTLIPENVYIFAESYCFKHKSNSCICLKNINKITKIQRWYKRMKYLKSKRLIILWRIAEYYSKQKYKPENILNYINLEDDNNYLSKFKF
jgi:hydroxymethylpyrimidine pyrophosphatase-like HAD family hydrolase